MGLGSRRPLSEFRAVPATVLHDLRFVIVQSLLLLRTYRSPHGRSRNQ